MRPTETRDPLSDNAGKILQRTIEQVADPTDSEAVRIAKVQGALKIAAAQTGALDKNR